MAKKQTKLIKVTTFKGSGMSLSSAWLAYVAQKLGYKVTYDVPLTINNPDFEQSKTIIKL